MTPLGSPGGCPGRHTASETTEATPYGFSLIPLVWCAKSVGRKPRFKKLFVFFGFFLFFRRAAPRAVRLGGLTSHHAASIVPGATACKWSHHPSHCRKKPWPICPLQKIIRLLGFFFCFSWRAAPRAVRFGGLSCHHEAPVSPEPPHVRGLSTLRTAANSRGPFARFRKFPTVFCFSSVR